MPLPNVVQGEKSLQKLSPANAPQKMKIKCDNGKPMEQLLVRARKDKPARLYL
jgi:hypothetical protein